MNNISSPALDKNSVSRDLDKAVRAVMTYVNDNPAIFEAVKVPTYVFEGVQQYGLPPALDAAYYFHAQSNNRKTFEKHVAALGKAVSPDAKLAALVMTAGTAYAVAEKFAADEKARLAAKREAVKAKAAQKAELGVDLKAKSAGKASVETYKLVRAAFLRVQTDLTVEITKSMTQARDAMIETLAKHGNDAALAYPAYEYKSARVRAGEIGSTPMFFWKYFDRLGVGFRDTKVTIRAGFNATKFIAAEAALKADEIVASYSAKLAGKIDGAADGRKIERVEHRLGGLNIWSFSHVHAFEAGDEVREQVWKTKVIWNRSCLGKDFNQWPTTRVA